MLRALKLDSFINQRRESAAYWTKKLSDHEDELILPIEPEHAKHVYFGYPITWGIGRRLHPKRTRGSLGDGTHRDAAHYGR